MKQTSLRLCGRIEQLRGALAQRPGIFEVASFSSVSLDERVAGYEPQAAALGAYFLMSLPAATPDRAVRNDWRVRVTDRDESPFAVSDPFNDSQ